MSIYLDVPGRDTGRCQWGECQTRRIIKRRRHAAGETDGHAHDECVIRQEYAYCAAHARRLGANPLMDSRIIKGGVVCHNRWLGTPRMRHCAHPSSGVDDAGHMQMWCCQCWESVPGDAAELGAPILPVALGIG